MPDATSAAIISYETDATNGGSPDALRFVLLNGLASGATIFITNRSWNGTAFTAGAGEGTYTFTAASNLAAGTIITLSAAQLSGAGITLSNAGDTIYLYQGAIDAPTSFLFAADVADGNNTFNGSLANTGLAAGSGAVAVAYDNAYFSGSPNQLPAVDRGHISTFAQWSGSDTDDVGGTSYSEVTDTSITNAFFTPDMVMIAAMAGGGQSDAILRIGDDQADGNGISALRLFRDDPAFNHLSDVTFDLESGYFFAVDSDGNSINRIIRGSIDDLYSGNPSPTFTQIFITDNQDNGAGAITPGEIVIGIEIDAATNKIYWLDGDIFGTYEGGFQLWEANYDGTGARLIQTIDTENPDGTFGFPGGVGDFAIAGGYAYVVASTSSIDGLGNANVLQNHILKINISSGAVTFLDLGDGVADGYHDGRLDPAQGQIAGIDVDTSTGNIWFVTQPISSTDHGGIFKFVPGATTGDVVAGTLTEVWEQPTNAAYDTLQTFPTANMTHIEVDEIGGRYFVSATSDSDTEDDASPATNESDASIFSGSLAAAPGTAPTLFVRVYEPTANGAPLGMEIDYAPVVSVTAAGSTYTESTSTLGSPAGPGVAVITSSTVNDADTATVQGANVVITSGLVAGDALSATLSIGVTSSYNAATGVLSLTGSASFADYQAMFNSVRFTNAGDNPTAYGTSTSRTISFSVFDGLALSDPATATIAVEGKNDTPSITVPGAQNTLEDTALAIAGLSVSDVDADPATANLTYTFQVSHGTVSLSTAVAGGITAGQVTNNGTGTVTVAATQNQINATLAAANGITYTPTANYSGGDTLAFSANDGGATGTSVGAPVPSANVSITVTEVNDAPGGSDATLTGNIDTTYVFSAANFGFTDVDGNAFAGVLVTTLPVKGVLYDNGNPITAGAFVTAATIAGGQFTYVPAAGESGTSYTSFTFQVRDNGGTSNGGVDTDPSANTITFDITSGNIPPAGTDKTITLDEDANVTLTVADFGFSDGDGDTFAAVKITTLPTAGTLTLNGGAVSAGQVVTLAQLNANQLVFTPVTNANGSGYASLTFQVQDTGGTADGGSDLDPSANTLTFNVTAVNDAPVNTVPAAQATNEDTALVFSGANGNAISVSDVDVGGGTMTVTLAATHGALTLSGTAGLVFAVGDGTADATMTFDGTAASINAALQGLTYNPAANYSGAAQLTITTNDKGNTGTGGALQDADTIGITVNSVNDAPAGTDKTITSNEDVPVTLVAADFGFSDADGNSLAAVKITTLPGAGSLTLNGGAVSAGQLVTLAQLNANQLVFTPAANANGNGYASLTFQVQDDGGTANGGINLDPSANTLTFNVTAVNDAPVNTVPAAQATNEDTALVFSGANGNAISVSDVDVGGGTMTVTLAATHGALTLSGTAGLVFAVGDGTADATMTFDGTAASINAALQGLTYNPAANYSGAAQLTITTNDKGNTGTGGALQDADTIGITVNSVNDAPAGTDKTITSNEDVPVTLVAADFGFSDTDGNSLAAVKITTLPGAGSLTLNGGAVSTGQLVTLAQLNANQLVFTPAANANGNGYASLTFQVQDDGGTANGGINLDPSANTLTFNVTAVNDAPVNTVPAAQATNEDTALVFSGANGNAISVSDVDVGGGTMTVTLAATHGALTLSGTAGLVFAVGDGTADATMTFDGTAASINAALQGLTYNPAANYSGAAQLTITTNDKGNTGTGGALQDADTIGITVNSVNDAPAGTDKTITSNEDVPVTLVAADFGFSDADGNSLAAVKITTLPGAGSLTLNGGAVSAGQLVTLAQLNANQLVFTPAANANGNGYASLTFQVQDDGGTANGGINLDPSANTLTFNVTAVNDAPVNSVPAAQATNEDTALVFSGANGNAISVSDVDVGGGTMTVTLAATHGALTLSGTAGLVFAVGDGTADATMTFDGTAASINAALQGLTYNPAANYSGAAQLTITTNDKGNTGTGGALQDADTIGITVVLVDDPGVARDDYFATTEATSFTASVFANNGSGGDFDSDSPLIVGAVGGNPAAVGSPVPVSSGSIVSIAANGTISYNPNGALGWLAAPGSGATNTSLTDTLTYTLQGGGTATVTVVVTGVDSADILYGTPGNDNLHAGNFDDVLIGGFGADRLDGEAGNDTVSYANDGAAVFVNLTLGRGYGNSAEGDTYFSIENVIGSSANDFLIGDPGVNRLDGGAGNDTIIGAIGPDVLIGGSGIDLLSFEDNSGTVFVNLLTGMGYNNAAQGDTFSGFENVIGGLFDDTLIGDNGANRLDGALGADTLVGNGGADTFVFRYAPGASSGFAHPNSNANVDTIFDFVSGEDKLEINSAAFGGGLAPGALAADQFLVGTVAGDANDRFIYDQASGLLYFDADGNGAGAPMLMAILPNHDTITPGDFMIV